MHTIKLYMYRALFSLIFFITSFVFVEAATLTLSPSSGTYNIGDKFAVNVLLNTQNVAIDGVDIRYLTYNPAFLEVVDDDANTQGVQIMSGTLMPVTPANVVTPLGKIAFSQSTAGGATFANSSDQVLATVHFQVKGSGYGSVVLDYTPGRTDDANVVTRGKEALESVGNASYTFGNPQQPIPLPRPSIVYIFARNLMVGAIGEDVRELQKFLNSHNFIIVISGPGSLGNETAYFGILTMRALIKFQEAYADEILVPVKLGRGNGYFGPGTRKKLNALLAAGGTSPTSQSQIELLQKQLRALQEQLRQLRGY